MDTWVVVVLATLALAEAQYIVDYPNPQIDFEKCGHPALGDESFICDPNKMLSDEEAKQVNKRLLAIQSETPCACGTYICQQVKDPAKIGTTVTVALIDEMNLPEIRNKNSVDEVFRVRLDEATKFSYNLLSRWKFGKCGDEVVIFVSFNDQIVYTMTGDASKYKLTKTLLSEIALNHRYHFEHRDSIMEGLLYVIDDYRKVLEDNYKSEVPAEQPRYAGLIQSGAAQTALSLFTTCVVALFTFMLH